MEQPLKPIGHTIIRLDETTSTNTLVMESEEYLENHGLVVTARHQTAGRGRIGRKWHSLPGSQLQFSTVIHPPLPREQVPVTSLMTGLAVAETLEAQLALQPKLKWPNDVLLGGRKVCGILMELKMRHRKDDPRLVVGVGINCLGGPGDYPVELRDTLTTLAHETGSEVDMERLLQGVLKALDSWFTRLVKGARPALLEGWNSRADLAGKKVRFRAAGGPKTGRAAGITEEGFLVVETEGGGRHIHTSGEIEWL